MKKTKTMKKLTVLMLFMAIILSVNCTSPAKQKLSGNSISPDTLGRILINQVGYFPGSVKIALLRVKTDKFEVIDVKTGNTVYQGKPGSCKYWELSGDSVCTADFSKVDKPGKYQLCLNNRSICSYVFEIGQNVYNEIAKASLKAFYLNRSGIKITSEFGGKWARAEGHPDTAVMVHVSAATKQRPEGTKISSPGGWYDAGDYNKYIVNSGITTYTLLLFYQMYPEYCKNFTDNIPESNNGISDVLNELLYNLRWMLTMQDPNDGGVYSKLTNKGFGGFIMPDKATDPRYVVMKTTAASLDFAATMAMASRVFGKCESSELKNLGKTCLAAAERAYKWAKANPEIYYRNPGDISTGAYGDLKIKDDFFWAGTEIGLAKNDVSLISKEEIESQVVIVPSWDTLGMLGIISLSLSDNPQFSEFKADAQRILLGYTDKLVKKSEESPYKISLDFFKWGSNSDVVNMALLKLVSYKITLVKKYLKSVQGDVDYILGRNATGYSFVTGFGTKRPMNIHHRPSGSDGIIDPYPGFLVGGPNTIVLNDCSDSARSRYPAKSYNDALCSYSTNEIAINWNAPLFFVLGSMDALNR
jgi:endoglucanase